MLQRRRWQLVWDLQEIKLPLCYLDDRISTLPPQFPSFVLRRPIARISSQRSSASNRPKPGCWIAFSPILAGKRKSSRIVPTHGPGAPVPRAKVLVVSQTPNPTLYNERERKTAKSFKSESGATGSTPASDRPARFHQDRTDLDEQAPGPPTSGSQRWKTVSPPTTVANTWMLRISDGSTVRGF